MGGLCSYPPRFPATRTSERRRSRALLLGPPCSCTQSGRPSGRPRTPLGTAGGLTDASWGQRQPGVAVVSCCLSLCAAQLSTHPSRRERQFTSFQVHRNHCLTVSSPSACSVTDSLPPCSRGIRRFTLGIHSSARRSVCSAPSREPTPILFELTMPNAVCDK